jgi:hypothetical protein
VGPAVTVKAHLQTGQPCLIELGQPVRVFTADWEPVSPDYAGPIILRPGLAKAIALVDAARSAGYRFVGLKPLGALIVPPKGHPRTPAQIEASRRNGSRGGRKKKLDKP